MGRRNHDAEIMVRYGAIIFMAILMIVFLIGMLGGCQGVGGTFPSSDYRVDPARVESPSTLAAVVAGIVQGPSFVRGEFTATQPARRKSPCTKS